MNPHLDWMCSVSWNNNYFLMVANLLVMGKSEHVAEEGIPDHSVTDKYLVKNLYSRRTKMCSYTGCLSFS